MQGIRGTLLNERLGRSAIVIVLLVLQQIKD
jgi:hypothetical protein